MYQTCCYSSDPAFITHNTAHSGFLSNSTCQNACNGVAYNENDHECCRFPSLNGKGEYHIKNKHDCEHHDMTCGSEKIRFEEHSQECCLLDNYDYDVFTIGECCDGQFVNSTSECCIQADGSQKLVIVGDCTSIFGYCGWDIYDKNEEKCCKSIQDWFYRVRVDQDCNEVEHDCHEEKYSAL